MELERLRAAYARAASGEPTLLLVEGAAGTGKSSLLRELRAPLAETFGYLACGKFDPYRRELPYGAFSQAFASLAQQLLTESDARLESWRRELCAGLGPIAAVLVGLVPDLGFVLGEVPAVPLLESAETRARLELAVLRFLQALASTEHPLVLALDDLQWADDESRTLLRRVLLACARARCWCSARTARASSGPTTRCSSCSPRSGAAACRSRRSRSARSPRATAPACSPTRSAGRWSRPARSRRSSRARPATRRCSCSSSSITCTTAG